MKRKLLINFFIALIFALGSLSSLNAQCTFTGLNANYCTNSSTSALVPGINGGVFTGPGITSTSTNGAVFNPSVAGPGPVAINYNVCSSTYSLTSSTFSPQGTTGNTLTMSDDSNSGSLNLGFSFTYFCNTYTTFNICSNGWLSFTNSGLTSYPGASMPTNATPYNVIAFAWCDLNPSNGGTITYTTVGSAPSRTLLVNFLAVPHYTGAGYPANPITTQVKLMETTNLIEIHTTSVVANGVAHTMGIQNANSSVSYTVAGRNAATSWTATNECYRWTPGTSCSVTQTTVVSPSTISVVGTNSICNGSTGTLTATGNTTYTWSTGSNATSINPAPTSNQTYSVSGTNSYGCVANSVITVTVDNTPTVTATSSNGSGVCPGKTVTVNGAGATSYTWTGATPTITDGVAFAPPTSAIYTVTGGNACGTATAAISVSIHPSPSVTPVASSSSLCSGSSLTLTGVGNATAYAWTGGASTVTNGIGFNPPLTATYTVIGTSALSCTASATIPVTVVTTPSIAATVSPSLICLGNSSTLIATGATSYTWTDGTQTTFTNSFIATPISSGISSYTITRLNGACSNTQVATVITNSLPAMFALASPSLVCASKPTTLAVAGGQTYTWTSPGLLPSVPSFTFSGASPLAYPPVSTTYTVAAFDGTCVNTTTVFVQADPNPTITTSASPSIICFGETSTITASGGTNYTITSSVSSATTNTLPISQVYTASASYFITGDNSFGCTSSAQQVVIVHPNPVVTASVVANKTLVCSSGSAAVNAVGADTYSWSTGSLTHSTIVNPVSLVSGPVIYTVTGTYTATTCHTDKTVAVNVFIPTITVTGNTTTCFGGLINLAAAGGTGGSNYRWYTVVGSPATSSISSISNTINTPAIYTITALTTSLTAVLCPSSKTVAVNIFFNPTITAVAQRTPICVKESVVLTGNGGDTYLWNTGGNTQTISVSPNSTTNYTVTGTDINGCVSTGTLQVKVSGCAGIATQSAANLGLSVYPNPSNGEFVIQSATDLKLTLVNDLGQLIRVIELSGANNYKVSVNDLAKGIYFLTGQKDNTQVNQKVIIAK